MARANKWARAHVSLIVRMIDTKYALPTPYVNRKTWGVVNWRASNYFFALGMLDAFTMFRRMTSSMYRGTQC